MSLIQEALDKAGMQAVSPKPAPVSHPAPVKPSKPDHVEKAPESVTEFLSKTTQPAQAIPWNERSKKKKTKAPILILLLILTIVTAGIFYLISSDIFVSSGEGDGVIQEMAMPEMPQIIKRKAPPKKAAVQKALKHVPDFASMFRLSGITSADGQKLALINNQVVSMGDTIDGVALLKEIGTKHVILVIKGQEVRITL